MTFAGTRFFSAVLLTSQDPERLVGFYRDVLGVPLEDEQHGNTAKHYGCEMGDLHFAIHPVENFKDLKEGQKPGVGAVKLAFEIFDMKAFVTHVESKGAKLMYPPRQQGPMTITALQDPDGNLVEFTELGDRWMSHLEKRRAEGNSMIDVWKKGKAGN